MKHINTALSQNREIHVDEEAIIDKAQNEGICEKIEEDYVLCANPSDHDYKTVPDRNCSGRIYLNARHNACPSCGRKVTEIGSKAVFTQKTVSLNKKGVRDFAREEIKKAFGTQVTTTSRSYCGMKNEYILDIQNPDKNLILCFRNRGEEYLEWCKLYDRRSRILLVDEAIALRNKAQSLNLPYFTIADVYPDINKEAKRVLTKQNNHLSDRMVKGQIAHNFGTQEDTLAKMNYDDFEQVVQGLLTGTVGNTKLLGSTESGSGVPDGVLSLHSTNGDFLYMWDAKFVDFVVGESNETGLSGEYDKIFRHLQDISEQSHVRKKFGQVQGIVLFSPGIKESNIRRLAEFIEEQGLMNQKQWSGNICYFSFDALLALFEKYRDDKARVKMKEQDFRTLLHLYLSTKSNHEDDPTAFQESPHNCVYVSRQDIDKIFAKLSEDYEIAEFEFNVRQYMSHLESITY